MRPGEAVESFVGLCDPVAAGYASWGPLGDLWEITPK